MRERLAGAAAFPWGERPGTVVLLGVVILLVAVLAAWRLAYTAARLGRLHTRAEGALAALDGQLVRRAEQALVSAGRLDDAPARDLAEAATACLRAGPLHGDTLAEAGVLGASDDRIDRENALTALLAQLPRDRLDDAELDRLDDVAWRVAVATHLHDDAVDDALRLRRRLWVRLFRLAGHAREPRRTGLRGL